MKKPFLQVEHAGHVISVINTMKLCALVIDGVEQEAYRGAVGGAFTLHGNAGESSVRAEFKLHWCGGTLYLYCDDRLLAKRFHL